MKILVIFFCFLSMATTTLYGQKPVLPLIAFSVADKGNYNLLEWSANEATIDYEVEVGNEEGKFKTIAIVGKGSQVYTYPDHHPTKGKMFYRLKMINSKGEVSYSPVKEIKKIAKISNTRKSGT